MSRQRIGAIGSVVIATTRLSFRPTLGLLAASWVNGPVDLRRGGALTHQHWRQACRWIRQLCKRLSMRCLMLTISRQTLIVQMFQCCRTTVRQSTSSCLTIPVRDSVAVELTALTGRTLATDTVAWALSEVEALRVVAAAGRIVS